jgi:hypothetical protein
MFKRPITALLAALALLAVIPAASVGQTPTPTPTPTATAAQDDGAAAEAPEDASKEVKAIYTDYSRDGVIDVCDHLRDDLQQTLDTIEADFDRDFPDFREAIEAGIRRHDGNRCADDEATPTPTASATATATPDDFSPDPTPTPDSGALPDPDDSSSDDGSGAIPPEDGTLPPDDGALPEALPEAGTAQPPAAVPAAPPPAAATTPAPSPTAVVVTRSGTDGLLIPGILIGVALLGAAALTATALGGSRSPRVQHAWSEALYRTRSTWADFSDWLRFGR